MRLGLLIAAVFATLISPITPQAIAFGGYASAPLSVSATAIAGGVRVGWSTPTDVDTGITGYRVEYSTSGTSGTWTLSTTVNSSTFSYDILGLSQVATYVRVAATTAAGTGTYGYPWTETYRTINSKRNSDNSTHTYVAGYGLSGGDAAANLNSTTNFSRVRYRMEATINGTSDYAETDFYKWSSASITTLQVPSISGTGNFSVQTNVTDLNVYSANSRVTKASGISGRIELWALNYGPERASDYNNGDINKYDYNDTNNGNGGYGSFQVHDITNFKTVFAWNHQSYTGNNDPDIGFGNNPNTNGHPDWTFCAQNNTTNGYCQNITNFKLQVFINLAVTPLADATPPTVSRGDAKTLIRSGDTITVRSTEIGTVYLVRNTVTVTNLASITAAAANVKNSVSISAINTNTTLTTSGLLDGTYNLYAADSANNLSTGLLATVAVDTTPPVASAFSVNTSGNAIQMTIGETATLAAFDAAAYSVSDSGSALSVTSASISGLVITLNLSRAIPAGATVTFAYSTSGLPVAARWSDAAGNQLNNVTSRTITNNSTAQISVGLTVADSMSKGTPITITASASVAGRVNFSIAGKRIPGCFNKLATGSTPITVTCTFKPALSGWQTITVTLIPSLSAYPTTLTTVNRFIAKRSNRR